MVLGATAIPKELEKNLSTPKVSEDKETGPFLPLWAIPGHSGTFQGIQGHSWAYKWQPNNTQNIAWLTNIDSIST